MTRLVYKISNGHGHLYSFTEGGAMLVEIKVEGIADGILSFGPQSARLKAGVCRMALAPLIDGDYTPKLCVGGELIYLDGVRKLGNKLTRPPISHENVERLLKRIEELEAREDDCLKRVEALEKRIDAPFIITKQS